MTKKAGDKRKRRSRGCWCASRRFADLDRLRLEIVQVRHGALRVRGRRKDEALVIGQNLQ